MKKDIWVFLLIWLVLCAGTVLTGCPGSPVEQQAYRIVVGAKAFTGSIANAHPECGNHPFPNVWTSAGNPNAPCPVLSRAIAAKDLLITATEVYCAGDQFESGGPCNPPNNKELARAMTDKVRAAIAAYEQAEKELKAVIK